MIPRSPFLSDGGMGLALATGSFEAHGVDHRIMEIRSPNEVFPLFLSGELDVWTGGVSDGVFRAIAEERDIRIILPVAILDPDACSPVAVIATPTGAATLLGMLDGSLDAATDELRIIGEARTLPTLLLRERLRDRLSAHGARVTWIVDVHNAGVPSAFASQAADAALVNEPWRTTVLTAGLAQDVVAGADITPGMVQSVLLMGPRLLGDEELAARVVAAYLQGVGLFRQGATESNVDALSALTGLDPDLLRAACWPTLAVDGRGSEEQLTLLQEFGLEEGLLDSRLAPDRLWRHDIVDRAREIVVPVAR